jgi:hypothetical protein
MDTTQRCQSHLMCCAPCKVLFWGNEILVFADETRIIVTLYLSDIGLALHREKPSDTQC